MKGEGQALWRSIHRGLPSLISGFCMRVELKNIHKTFGLGAMAVHANDDITLTIPAGTIQGILGENGAGKSTLMKVLSGFIQEDRGEILLDGKPVSIQSPNDAIRQGIGMLHQDPLDFPPMQVIDNFLIGSNGSIFPKKRDATAQFIELQNQFDFSIDPESYVDSLTVGERQQLEILRLLWLGARVLILDEPTTGISAIQKEKLFSTLRLLAQQDKTIIFVSHKLEDVEQLCHQAAVLRQGKLVGETCAPYDPDRLVELMFGKAVPLGDRRPCPPGEAVLALDGICIEDYRLHINKADLDVYAGEVIGLAGMEGSGQGLFLRSCGGLVRPVDGKISVRGSNLTGKTYHAFMQHGVAFLPASRLEEGLVPGLTLTEHFLLSEETRGVFIDWDQGRRISEERITEFNIRGTSSSRVESLSGGNQQRALLALLRDPLSLILLEHPTRGLDIESSIYIWNKLKERCQQGAAILFISSDLEEILRYSDRILVFFSG
ncbi:MAG: ATP-binding cassette domain-containing protein, partial [Chloroflexota bacterium]